MSSKFDVFLAGRSQFDSDHRVDCYAPTCCLSETFAPPHFAFVLCFLRQQIIINNVAFRHILRCLRCSFRIDVANALRQIRLIARWRKFINAELDVGMSSGEQTSWGSEG